MVGRRSPCATPQHQGVLAQHRESLQRGQIGEAAADLLLHRFAKLVGHGRIYARRCATARRKARIHVAIAGFDAKFWLSPARLAVNHGFKAHDLREIGKIIEENETLILEKWDEFFRPQS